MAKKQEYNDCKVSGNIAYQSEHTKSDLQLTSKDLINVFLIVSQISDYLALDKFSSKKTFWLYHQY